MSTQNKFTKSVFERLEQEAQVHKTRQVEVTETPEKNSNKTVKAQEVEKITKNNRADENRGVVKKSAIPDLSSFVIKTPQRVAKNKTFYLDEDVINALSAAAKSQKTTDSRLCNDILRTVLGIGE